MSKRIFITATNTDIGKSYTTLKLLESFSSKGYKVGAIKPIETGVIDGYAPDGVLLLQKMQQCNEVLKNFNLDDVVPIQYELAAAPAIAAKNVVLDIEKIDKALSKMEEVCDIVLIEGAGGLLVPLDDNMMMIDLISHFNAIALLVTHCALGCINDTLLSVKLLEDAGIKHHFVFNCREENSNFSEVSEPYFLKNGKKVLKVSNDIDTLCELLYNC